jgi:hypothetical protein
VNNLLPLFLAAFVQVADPATSGRVALTSETCQTGVTAPSEVVVCGRRGDESSSYRLKDMPPPRSAIPRAEARLSEEVRAIAETENAEVGGRPSNRLMVRLKFKF